MTHLVRLVLLVTTLHLLACSDEFATERFGTAEAGASAAGAAGAAGGENSTGGTGGASAAGGGAGTAAGGQLTGGGAGAAGEGGVAGGPASGGAGGTGGVVNSVCDNWGPARDPRTGNGWAVPGGLYVEGDILWKFVGPGDGVIGWNCAPTNTLREVYCKTWWEKVQDC